LIADFRELMDLRGANEARLGTQNAHPLSKK
jgi:hypothetical protein